MADTTQVHQIVVEVIVEGTPNANLHQLVVEVVYLESEEPAQVGSEALPVVFIAT